MTNFLRIICFIIFFSNYIFANDSTEIKTLSQKYLHISTNPAYADVYINNPKPNHSKNPDYKLPTFIPISNNESNILISIFRPEFTDTTINVTLSQKDTSFLIVSLRPSYNEKLIEKQYNDISHRKRKNIGHHLLLSSIVPFVASGIAATITYYNIDKANKEKENLNKALFKNTKTYQDSFHKYNDYREKAKNSKNLMNMGLIFGGIILTTGIVLSF